MRRSSGQLSVLSLFSGGLGLDLGLEKAGFKVRVAVDCNKHAAETIRANRNDIVVFEKRIEDVSTAELLAAAELRVGELTLVSAGPACQSFSTAGQRRAMKDPRGVMFREFIRVVREARPRFFVLENVTGIFSAPIRHRRLIERGPGYPRLRPDEHLGTGFALVVKELRALGYYVQFDVLNAADFGVPQRRRRVIFIGSRDGEQITMPEPTHSERGGAGRQKWVSLRTALRGLRERAPVTPALTAKAKRYLTRVPPGGNWRDLPRHLQSRAMGRAYVSWGGRSGFYRRLAWNEPSPTLPTSPNAQATMLCHPTKLRALSIREYARLQQFPDDWSFSGKMTNQYELLGNAVPLGLGAAVGRAVRKAMRKERKDRMLLGVVASHNSDLLEKISKRPITILNPPRMRRKWKKADHPWLGHSRPARVLLLDKVTPRRSPPRGRSSRVPGERAAS